MPSSAKVSACGARCLPGTTLKGADDNHCRPISNPPRPAAAAAAQGNGAETTRLTKELDRTRAELQKTREDAAAQLTAISAENEVRVSAPIG